MSQLAVILQEETDDKIRSATIWSLGQIGCHTTEHAKAIAVANVLPRYYFVQCQLSTEFNFKVA